MNTVFAAIIIMAAGTGEADLSRWLSIALENSPELVVDSCSVVQAEASRTSALSSVLPSLSASGSIGKSWQEDSSGEYAEDDLRLSGGVSLSLPLLASGGSDWLRLESASLEEEMARLELRAGNLALQKSVAFAYYRTAGALQKLEAAGEALTRDSILLERTEAMTEMGAATTSELLAARLQETASRVEVMEAESQFQGYLDELRRTAGVLNSGNWTVDPLLLPREPDFSDLAVLPDTPDGSPSLRVAQLRVQVAEIDRTASGRERFPSLSASGSWNWSGSNSGSVSGTGSFSTGLSLSVPIFDGGRISAGVTSARASMLSAGASLEIERQSLQSELSSLNRNLETAMETLGMSRLSVEYAAQRLELIETKYEMGAVSMDELIDARQELIQAEYQLIENRIECLEHETEYRVLCGMDVRSGE